MEYQTTNTASDLNALAKQTGFSRAAVDAANDALTRSGGNAAQFSHPELGGSVQWMRGGMLQIGDMFNHDLKARVAKLLEALSASPASPATAKPHEESQPTAKSSEKSWWPEGLGAPATVGGQNEQRYAFFPDAHRLVVEDNGRRTLYDTGSHRITGAAQGQGTGEKRRLAFSSADGGVVDVADLPVVG